MSAWVDSAGCHIATHHVALGERDLLAPHERQSLESEHLPASHLACVAYDIPVMRETLADGGRDGAPTRTIGAV